jgi:hypothetical protein
MPIRSVLIDFPEQLPSVATGTSGSKPGTG